MSQTKLRLITMLDSQVCLLHFYQNKVERALQVKKNTFCTILYFIETLHPVQFKLHVNWKEVRI